MARTFLTPLFRPIERGLYRIAGSKEDEEQHWTAYTAALLFFSIASIVLLYLIQRFQAVLPFNPAGMAAVPPELAFNTAVSFTTNTNWQNYAGESTMSYFTQMAGLAVQNFVSAAAGMAISVALIRAFARRSVQTLGSFWVDLTRSVLYVLLPICVLGPSSWSGRAFRKT